MLNIKKKHFKDKLAYTQKQIWEIEFKINTSRKVREDVRVSRDRCVEAYNQIENRLKEVKGEEKKKLEEEQVKIKDDQLRFEAQMDMIDREVYGVQPTKETQGQQGLQDHLDSLISLREMVKDYIKTL